MSRKHRRSRTIHNSDGPDVVLECSETKLIPGADGKPSQVEFVGYSGGAVNLRDHGYDAPVVYDIASMEIKEPTKILYNHSEPLGHTTKIVKAQHNSSLKGKGVLSIRNARTEEVEGGMRNEFPYESSMGLRVADITRQTKFHSKGTVTVNNQTFQAPLYVISNTVLREITLTPFGRDSNTSFKVLNEEDKMLIKNAEPNEGTPPPKTPTPPKATNAPKDGEGTSSDPPQEGADGEGQSQAQGQSTVQGAGHTGHSGAANYVGTTLPVNSTGRITNEEGDDVILNNSGVKALFRAQRLINKYPKHIDIIENAMDNGWDDERIDREVRLYDFEHGQPRLPRHNVKPEQQHQLFEARMGLAYGLIPETLEKKFGEEIANKANDLPEFSVVEQLLYVANSQGGNFTGHSDIENMCTYIKNVGFSTFDLPGYLQKTAQGLLEQRWTLDPPFAPRFLKEGSNKDFRKTERRRLTGGQMWDGVAPDGRLKHYSPGKDTYYQTSLTTVGNIFTMTREEIINDDQGVLRELMDAMIEGAYMVPDYQLGMLMFKEAAAAGFWIDGVNSHKPLPLTRENLGIRYKSLRTYQDNRAGVNWNVMVNDKWNLVIGPALEDVAWDIIKQDKIVQGATGEIVGDKNYWFNRLNITLFPQMGNESIFGPSEFNKVDSWFLWPSSAKFSPYEITYLRNRKRPVIEPIDLPGDMLGRGIRGYWDVKVNERENMMVERAAPVDPA